MSFNMIGHPGGKAQLERTVTGRRQLVCSDHACRAHQQIGPNATRHAAGEHQILGRRLALRQILGIKRRRGVVALHQTHAIRIAASKHVGKQPGQAIEILGVEHTGGRAAQTQIALSGPIGNVVGALMTVERVACNLIRVIAGSTQTLTRRVHARSLKIFVGLERLVATRHEVERRGLLERERVHRHMMRRRRQHAIECALPA